MLVVEGFTFREAATICGISPTAFRQRLSRARARLGRLLDESAEVDVAAARGALA